MSDFVFKGEAVAGGRSLSKDELVTELKDKHGIDITGEFKIQWVDGWYNGDEGWVAKYRNCDLAVVYHEREYYCYGVVRLGTLTTINIKPRPKATKESVMEECKSLVDNMAKLLNGT